MKHRWNTDNKTNDARITAARFPDRDPQHALDETGDGQFIEAESDAGELIAVPATEAFPKDSPAGRT